MFDDMWMHANQEFVHCMFMWRNFKLWRFVSLKLRKSNMSPRLTGIYKRKRVVSISKVPSLSYVILKSHSLTNKPFMNTWNSVIFGCHCGGKKWQIRWKPSVSHKVWKLVLDCGRRLPFCRRSNSGWTITRAGQELGKSWGI